MSSVGSSPLSQLLERTSHRRPTQHDRVLVPYTSLRIPFPGRTLSINLIASSLITLTTISLAKIKEAVRALEGIQVKDLVQLLGRYGSCTSGDLVR